MRVQYELFQRGQTVKFDRLNRWLTESHSLITRLQRKPIEKLLEIVTNRRKVILVQDNDRSSSY